MAGHLMMLLLRGRGAVAAAVGFLLTTLDGDVITDQTGDPLRTIQNG